MKLENRLQQILLTGLALADVTSAQGFGMGASGPTSRVSSNILKIKKKCLTTQYG